MQYFANIQNYAQRWVSQIVVAPSFIAILFFAYGFIIWTTYNSMTNSTMLPSYQFVGLSQYTSLFGMSRWSTALSNLLIFGSLFIFASLSIGLLLAILLDQRIRMEGVLRTIILYPMALSFVVTGTIWKWILNPGLGLEKAVRELGWESFQFDWIVRPDMAIYTLAIAGVWQCSGMVMALFLAALRGVDQDIVKAAHMDGASLPRIYFRIIIPSIKPVFLSVFVILSHLAIKSFDLVIALTNGGPGYATDLPATFMFAMTFERNRMALGSASAIIMLCAVMAIIIPYLYSELHAKKHD